MIRQSVIDDYNRVLDLIEDAHKLAVKLDAETSEHLHMAKCSMESVLARTTAAKSREDWKDRPQMAPST